jgi:cellulose synthase/poly-beta-1,6-N-acetylglucosamine synthase-like glycosyltransferase
MIKPAHGSHEADQLTALSSRPQAATRGDRDGSVVTEPTCECAGGASDRLHSDGGRCKQGSVTAPEPPLPASERENVVAEFAVSLVMPTVSWTGAFSACGRRVLELLDKASTPAEFIVVFDGPAPATPKWLDRPNVRILSTGRRAGPARARNLAAQSARGHALFFVDSDVEIAEHAIEHVAAAFASDPDLSAIFGAYDDEPAAEGVVSQFRNLLHHHTHVAHPGEAGTFWSGCGAIRAAVFADVGGFDENYAFPSVEDIELGMRIATQGGRILLDPDLRCKHLKQWTFPGMVVADVFHRARPWTHLIMESQQLPATLNIDWKGRISGVLSLVMAASLLLILFVPAARWLTLAAAVGLVAMNFGFYSLCLRKRGLRFAASSFALHSLYFLYSTITFAVVVLLEFFGWAQRPNACHLPSPIAADHELTNVAMTPHTAR